MCGSMVDIQSLTAGLGEEKEDRKKSQGKNIMVFPITMGDHNNQGCSGERRPTHIHGQ